MADGVSITSGAGTNIATNEVGGYHYQRIKVTAGAAGTATDVGIGGGTEATAIRVTVATDSTGVLSVDDNGGSLTVDDGGGSLTVDNSGTFAVQVSSALPAGTNAIGKLSANSGVDIGDVDVTSVVPGTGATSLGKAEDAAHASGDVGVMALAVRQDSDASLSSATGDYSPLQVDSNGYLKVNIKAGAGAGGTSSTDDAAFTVGAGSGTPIMGYAAADSVDSGDVGVVRMTTARSLHTVVTNSTGSVIDPQADDAAFTVAASLISVVGGVNTTDSVDSGDAGALAMTASRALHVTLKTDSVGGTSVYKSLDLDETEEDVKTSAGTLYWVHAVNLTADPLYLKFYNATAANVTVGTTTPVLTFPVVSQGSTDGAGFVFSVPHGIAFNTAISMAATTGLSDADTGAPGANALVVNVGYA